MAHLERPIDQMANDKIFRLFIATITIDGPRMTIEKSRTPFAQDLSAFLLFLVFGGIVFVVTGIYLHGASMLHALETTWPLLVMMAIAFLVLNYQGLYDLFGTPDVTTIDSSKNMIYWNGQYAAEVTEVEAVRIWARIENRIPRYRISLMLQGNRALHLVETPQFDTAESFRRSTFVQPTCSMTFFGVGPVWEPCQMSLTGEDNGAYDQFAFAWLLARFLNVPIA